MKINVYIIIVIMSFSGASAQMTSTNYQSPANGIASSGGMIQSQNYGGSAAILWFDSQVSLSSNYTQTGIGNLEILNRNSTTDVVENKMETIQNSVFPNPVREESVLRFSTLKTGIATLEIFDYTGKKIYTEMVNIYSEGIVTIPLAEFYRSTGVGVYMLKFRIDTELKTMMIVRM